MLTKIHHVGLVVQNLDVAYRFWRDTVGLEVHKEATVPDQGVKAALLPCGETEIELLEPIDPQGGVAKFLAKRGEGLHHLCFEADDVATELSSAKAKGLPMLDESPRRGLAGMIGFLHPKASCGVLVEFAQPPAAAPTPAGIEVGFDHLAIVADDATAATETFRRNFGLSPQVAHAQASPIRMPISRSAIHFYPVSDAPPELAGIRGLAGIGLTLSADDRLQRIRAGAPTPGGGSNTSVGYATKAHGVLLAFRLGDVT